jgi:hypothetical protein
MRTRSNATTWTAWSAPPARQPACPAAYAGQGAGPPGRAANLDQMTMAVYLRNGRFHVLAANDVGRARGG